MGTGVAPSGACVPHHLYPTDRQTDRQRTLSVGVRCGGLAVYVSGHGSTGCHREYGVFGGPAAVFLAARQFSFLTGVPAGIAGVRQFRSASPGPSDRCRRALSLDRAVWRTGGQSVLDDGQLRIRCPAGQTTFRPDRSGSHCGRDRRRIPYHLTRPGDRHPQPYFTSGRPTDSLSAAYSLRMAAARGAAAEYHQSQTEDEHPPPGPAPSDFW